MTDALPLFYILLYTYIFSFSFYIYNLGRAIALFFPLRRAISFIVRECENMEREENRL